MFKVPKSKAPAASKRVKQVAVVSARQSRRIKLPQVDTWPLR
jgi:16S rRNA U1498 N3-methylase RsmE